MEKGPTLDPSLKKATEIAAYHWNILMPELEPKQNGPTEERPELWVPYGSNMPERYESGEMPPDPRSIRLGTMYEVRAAWNVAREQPETKEQLRLWFERPSQQRNYRPGIPGVVSGFDGRNVLATAHLYDDGTVKYTFSGNFRYGDDYVIPLDNA